MSKIQSIASINAQSNTIKESQIAEIKQKISDNKQISIDMHFISDLGADVHSFMVKNNLLKGEISTSGYFTSKSAFDKYTGDNAIYTGHKDTNRTIGSGQSLAKGIDNALSVKDEIKGSLATSEARILHGIGGAGGGSTFPELMVRAKLYEDMLQTQNKTSTFDDFDLSDLSALSAVATMPERGFVDTILVPSTVNSSVYFNYTTAMTKFLTCSKEKGCPSSYQLVKVDDVQNKTNGINSDQENMIATANAAAKLNYIMSTMIDTKATEGTDIDLSELLKLLNAKGEIIANLGAGFDMSVAFASFKRNMLDNNKAASLLGASDILVKFLYPTKGYSQQMTQDEANIIEQLSNAASTNTGLQPTLKKSVTTGYSFVNAPTIMILAGGIMSETQRNEAKKTAYNSQTTADLAFLSQDFDATVNVNEIELAFINAGVEMTKSPNSYAGSLRHGKESVQNSTTLSDIEKKILLSISNK